jgi:DNA-binding HxlR family transcriptional regulator
MSSRFVEMVHICTQDDPKVFRSVLDRVADKWSLIVIGLLEERTLRFTELLAAIPGISRRMLTVTLRSLERDGLITRKVYAEVPPRVEYRATELGVALSAPVIELATWIARHKDQIQAHRFAFDDAAEDANEALSQ